MWEHISHSPQNGSTLTSDHGRNQSSHHDKMAQPLHMTMKGTNPLTMSEWLIDSSLPLWGNLDLENTKLLPEVLKLHSGQWLRQHISYLCICRNILELHCSSLHHIPDIVILISICFDLSWNIGFSDNFTQLWLSQYIQVASIWRSNKSDSIFLSHTTSQLSK